MNGTWVEALDEFEAYLLTSSRSSTTVTEYIRQLRILAGWSTVEPWDLTSADLNTWLTGQNWSQETRRKVTVTVKLFYGWAVREGYLEWAPTAGLPKLAPKARGPQPAKTPGAWHEPLQRYLTACMAAAHSKGTLGQHRHYINHLAGLAADPWAVTPWQLEEWLANPEWAPNTKRMARKEVQLFYKWAVKSGLVPSSPAAELAPVRVPRVVPRPAPDADVRAALATADDRTRLAIMLGALAGLRRAEIAGLHTASVTTTHLLVTGKGGHQRTVPIHPDLHLEIAAERARRRDGRCGSGWTMGRFVTDPGYLFPSDRGPGPITPGHLAKTIRDALPGDWTTHNLRHRFATAAYSTQRDLRAVQELLGHARPETTSRYAAVPEGALHDAVSGVGLTRY